MIDIAYFKKKLGEEKNRLEEELGEVGIKDKDDPTLWTPTPGEVSDFDTADKNEVADRFEEYGERATIEVTLEQRLKNVTDALSRIEAGTYGFCKIGGERHEIEQERLNANPAAGACLKHLDEELS